MRIRVLLGWCFVVAFALAHAGGAWADELMVLSTPTLKSALQALAPAFEQQTGHKLNARYDNASALKNAIDAGAAVDVAILLPAQIDELIRRNRIAAGSRADIASAPVGMAIRADLPSPNVDTVDAFRQALLGVRSLSWSPGSASGAYFLSVLDRLGIADVIQPRLVPVQGGDVIAAVANRSADASVISTPNIVDVPGVKLAGLLPPELQHVTVYSAGLGMHTGNAAGAEALIRFLLSPEATAVLHAKGLERAEH